MSLVQNAGDLAPVVTVSQMRSMERFAIREFGIPELVLMENAGAGAARAILGEDKSRQGSVLVVVGPGNNGGDGYVVARHMHNAGLQVSLAVAGEPRTAVARANANITTALGIARFAANEPAAWPRSAVVVDALLGIGMTGTLRADAAVLIAHMNALRAQGSSIVALDVPSGLDADTGILAQPTVEADLTLTFGACKSGLLAPQARAHVGWITIIDISLPRVLLARACDGGQ